MSHSSPTQGSFLGGEWSPFAQGKIDDPVYRTALNKCRNALPLESGAWTRRPGFMFAGRTNRGHYAKIFNFAFSNDAPFTVEVGYDSGTSTSYARFWRCADLITEPAKNISASSGTPNEWTTSSSHGYSVGDDVVFISPTTSDSRNGAALLNRVFKIATTSTAAKFTVTDAITGTAVNAADFVFDSMVTNQVARVVKKSLPYTSVAEVSAVKAILAPQDSSLSNISDILLLHPSYAPRKLTSTAYPTPPTFPTIGSVSTITFDDGPYVAVQESGAATISAASGSGVTFSYNSSGGTNYINAGAGFTSGDIGRSIRMVSIPAAWDDSTVYNEGDVVSVGTWPNTTYYVAVATTTAGDAPGDFVNEWVTTYPRAWWGWAKITAVTDQDTCTVTIQDEGLDPDNYTNIVFWQMDWFNATWGYPIAGTYTRGRLWLANALGQLGRFDGSVSGDPYNFAPTNRDGTVGDANAVSFTIADPNPTHIQWLDADHQGLLVGQARSVSLIQANNLNDPITPTNIQANRIGSFGANGVFPVRAGATLITVDRSLRRLFEVISDGYSSRFTGRLLTQQAQHLFTSANITKIQYQDMTQPVIWLAGPGGLIGCTYRRIGFYSNSPADICGFHKHTLGTGWTVSDVATSAYAYPVTGTTPGTDEVATIISVDGSSVYNVEVLQPFFDENRSSFDGCFLDSRPRDIVGRDPALDSGSAGIDFYGLTHLEGQTVTVMVAGLNFGTKTVSGGKVNISYAGDADGLGTATYLQGLSASADTLHGMGAVCDLKITGSRVQVTLPVVIGKPYTSEGQLLRPDAQQLAKVQSGGAQGMTRRIYRYAALLSNSGAASFGPDSSHTYSAAFGSYPDGPAGAASTMFSGVYQDTINDDWTYDGMLYWSCNSPYPMTVAAITPFLEVTER